MNRLVLLLLMLLVVLAPMPLGANRAWAWDLCAVLAAGIALLWLLACGWRERTAAAPLHPAIPALFVLTCAWVLLQTQTWVPAGWKHPVWEQTGQVLGTALPGMISVSADDSRDGLMRLFAYALVFFVALRLGRERSRARAMLGWIATAGLAYALFGLVVFWSGYHPDWLFGDKVLLPDVRGTFVNRNHFATWLGLTLLCAITVFSLTLGARRVRPYVLPEDRITRLETFVLQAWWPLTVILLTVTALVLTHSRGGFVSTLAGVVVLLLLLDRRSNARRYPARAVVLSALAVCTLAFYLTSEVLLERIDRTDITSEQRLVVFDNVRRAIGENPWLGFGYGTFADSFRLYDRIETPVHYDRAHNTWLENLFELGVPAALCLFLALGGLAATCLRGFFRRRRDWAIPAAGVAASVLVGVHAMLDFSLQLPAVAILYACIMGIACAQSFSSRA